MRRGFILAKLSWFSSFPPLKKSSTLTATASPCRTTPSSLSGQLNIRFELTAETLVIYRPDGSRFLTFVELGQQLDEAQADNAWLIAKLKALGIDPSA